MLQVEELRKARRKRNVGRRNSSMLQVKKLRKVKRKRNVSKEK
ncbi:hypothetical protein bcere0005_41860 [Bacillus cereus 172560W]|nr:hypothetical protein bcere0005_41860 [Bacillus cereus 172560W]